MTSLDTAMLLSTTLWAGLVAGISFVAQPAKFKVAQLTGPTALLVGRRIFHAMHATEAFLAITSLVLLAVRRSHGDASTGLLGNACLYAASLILYAQATLLMPQLSERVDAIQAGLTLPRSRHHLVYALLEVSKVSLLILFSLSLLN